MLNIDKCLVWGPAFGLYRDARRSDAVNEVLVVPWTLGSGIKVLGVPVTYPGTTVYADRVWDARVAKVHKTLQVLEHLPESHIQYTLLKYCLSACKVNDLLRASLSHTPRRPVRTCPWT